MSNLLGQPFDEWVTKQINVRQESLGKSTNIPSQDLQYYITKAPWIRLASSVDLILDRDESGSLKNMVPKKLEESGVPINDFTGGELARNVILQGGTLSANIGENGEIRSNGLNSGLNNGSSIFNGAYGWGGIEERGYVPMPGITNADVQYLSNGALTKTTINIKCFSKRQFQLIDVLYLRPGYTLLLEFGHSVYLDNEGKKQSFDQFSTDPLRTLLNPTISSGSVISTQYDIYRQIAETREKHKGNYEAVYGKISNFNWQFNADGSYDCQVQLTGMGDVIESLKMNTTIDAGAIQVGDDEGGIKNPGTPSQNPIIANRNKTQLNEILYRLFQQIKGTSSITSYNLTIFNFSNPNKDFKVESLKIPHSLLSIKNNNENGQENQSPNTYMTFGTLISYIQNQFLLYSKEIAGTRIPLFKFDMDFDDLANDKNYILRFPGEFSADPTICLIPYTNTAKPCPNVDLPTSVINDGVVKYSSFNVKESLYAGRLAGIYVNMGFISTTLAALTPDEEMKISVLDFLKNIIKGITQSLGGFNKITIKRTIDGKIQFIEDIPQSLNINKTDKEYARFNVFGRNSDSEKNYVEGSFVKSLNLTADLGSDFAAMITIGAQNNANQLSGNALSFANYNSGLKDRIVPEKSSYSSKTQSDEDKNDKNKEQSTTIKSNFRKIEDGTSTNLISGIYNAKNFINDNISTLKSLNSTHADLVVGRISQPSEDQQIQSPFFLPFNFSLEIEGLSGMKLYQKFKISNNVLPPSYENDGVDIQIKGINHSINTTAWTTKLDTLSVPAFKTQNTITQHQPYPLGQPSKVYPSGETYPLGNFGDTVSLTSGFPMTKIFYDGPTNKKQIYLHHTAGATKSPSRTIESWSKRTDHVATHYITNNLGDKEQLFADEAWANHLGVGTEAFANAGVPYQNLNKISLGIEMQSYGWLKFNSRTNQYETAYHNPSEGKYSTVPASEVAQPIGKNGEFIEYKGKKYYQRYNAANIAHVKTIVTGWMSKFGIPFVYNYDELFPNLNQPLIKKALAGTPGVYTHNSVRSGKSDVFPQKELIDMLKSISQ